MGCHHSIIGVVHILMTCAPHPDADTYRTPEAYPLDVGARVFDIKQLCDEQVEEPEAAIVIDTSDVDIFDATFQPSETDSPDVSPTDCDRTDASPDQDRHPDHSERSNSQPLADYQPNQRYADYDTSRRVVTIAWTSYLDAHAAQWRAHLESPSELLPYLRGLEADWDIPVSDHLYDYPESRLMHPAYLGQ